MITPASPLLTTLVHISPSYWTIYRPFDIILEMGTVHWIGIHIQCSISGVGKLDSRVFCRNQKHQRAAKSVCSVTVFFKVF